MLLPYQKFTLQSHLRSDEVIQRLNAVIKPPRKWSLNPFNKGDGKFQGEVTGSRFQIIRDIAYRNSFLPMVRGVVTPSAEGSTIKVVIRMNVLVIAFMLLWLGGVCLAIFTTFHQISTCQGNHCTGLIVPIGMFIFGLVLPLIGFLPEAWKAKKFLSSTLEATEVKS
jgi:hypothetical protein